MSRKNGETWGTLVPISSVRYNYFASAGAFDFR